MGWELDNGIGNFSIAIVTSYVLARVLEDRLPPLWAGHSRVVRFSLRTLLGGITAFCILLGLALKSPSLGYAVRNVCCFGGPIAAAAWLLYRQQVSWVRLGILSVGFTMLTLMIDFHYLGSGFFYLVFRDLTVIRAVVPVFGLLSLLAIAHPAYLTIRRYWPVWARRIRELHGTTAWDERGGDDEERPNLRA